MTSSRLLLATLLLSLVGGCGKTEPTKPVETKPGDKNDSTQGSSTPGPGSSNTGGPGPTPPGPPGTALLSPNDPIQQFAEKFVTDLLKASTMAGAFPQDLMDRVSPSFLKVIGKPVLTEADKKASFSVDAAQAWLRRAGTAMNGVGLPRGHGSPSAAVFVGSGIAGGPDRFLLRVVQEQGGWKVAWFELGAVKTAEGKTTGPDGPFQDFAVLAFLDAITANTGSKDDRALLLGGLLSAKLKNSWAEPFQQDKDRGYDFSAVKLGMKADEFGAGITGFTRTADGETYKIELMKGQTNTAYTLKLTKGASEGEWLVDEFTKQ